MKYTIKWTYNKKESYYFFRGPLLGEEGFKKIINICPKPGLANPQPSTAMNPARHTMINFFKTLRFLYTYWKTHLIQFDLFFFLFNKKKSDNLPKNFRKIKGQILVFESEKIYFMIFEKIITSLSYFDSFFY